MIGTKKHGVQLENSLGPFALHDASKSNLVIPIEIGRSFFDSSN
jgi:hypothetical protein